jgi:serine/threonine-protein kinase
MLPPDPAPRFPTGRLLGGKYRVEREVGRGGMGIVLEATELPLQRRVAIKLLASASPRSSAYRRFVREAEVVSSLDSDHVVRLLDRGTEQGDPFLVMEYLEGEDLAARLRRRRRLAPAEAASYVLQACEGLGEAHRKGIVHRDLKPSNLFLVTREDGSTLVKVLDFGISKVLDGQQSELTATLSALGTAPYMSPEQIRSSRRVDQRTDLWSLGVILYEELTGRLPFHGKTAMAVGSAILARSHPPLEEVRQDIPFGLIAIVNRCLLKDRRLRYASVGELAAALAPFARPGQAPSPGADDAPTAVMRSSGYNVPRLHFTTDSSDDVARAPGTAPSIPGMDDSFVTEVRPPALLTVDDQALTEVIRPAMPSVDDQALTGVVRPATPSAEERGSARMMRPVLPSVDDQAPTRVTTAPVSSTGAESLPIHPIEGLLHRPRAPGRSRRAGSLRPERRRPGRGGVGRWPYWLAGGGIAVLAALLTALALRR